MSNLDVPLSASLTMRPVRQSDNPLLQRIYIAGRTDLALADADPEYIRTVILQQMQARDQGLGNKYPSRQDFVIQRIGVPIGHMMLGRSPEEVRLASLRFIPEVDRQQTFAEILPALQAGSSGSGLPLRIVLLDSDWGWISILKKAGFTVEEDNGCQSLFVFVPTARHRSYFFPGMPSGRWQG